MPAEIAAERAQVVKGFQEVLLEGFVFQETSDDAFPVLEVAAQKTDLVRGRFDTLNRVADIGSVGGHHVVKFRGDGVELARESFQVRDGGVQRLGVGFYELVQGIQSRERLPGDSVEVFHQTTQVC